MKLLIIAAAFLGLGVLAREADGAEKQTKPVVCLHYAVAKTDKANDDAVAICYDGKKPQLFYRFEEKELPGQESGRIKVLLGWR